MWDDDKPKPKPKTAVGDDLTNLSVAELEARITALQSEIERTRTEMTRKTAQSKLAQDLFKS